jgi:hypothetical protein
MGFFDATTVAPSTGRETIPAGNYKVVISKTEEKDSKATQGASYLNLEFTIIEGEFEKRKLYAILNLNHPSDVAVGIARADLSAICHAVGVLQPETPDDLKDIPLFIKVAIQPPKGDYPESNRVVGYKSIEAGSKKSTPSQPPTSSTSNTSTTATKGKMPWVKK